MFRGGIVQDAQRIVISVEIRLADMRMSRETIPLHLLMRDATAVVRA